MKLLSAWNRIGDLAVGAEVGHVVKAERDASAVVRLVPRQFERAELAGKRQMLFIVDMALAAYAQHRVLGHQVFDQIDERLVGPGDIGAGKLGREQGVQCVDVHRSLPLRRRFT